MEEQENQFSAKILDDENIVLDNNISQEEEVINESTIQTEEIVEGVEGTNDDTTEGTTEGIIEQPEEVTNKLTDEDILSFLKEKYQKEYNSLDEIVKEKEDIKLPDEVSKFLEYQKETGRGLSDYLEATKDYSNESDEVKIEKFIRNQNPDYDDEDVAYELERLSVDEEYDTEKEIRDKKREKKKILSEANKFLESNRKKYYTPSESDANVKIPEDYEEIKRVLQEREIENEKIEKLNLEAREYFVGETEKLFNNEFKGFEFDLGETKQVYTPTDVKGLKNMQSDVTNFISKHVDDSGRIKNAAEYHKALTMALNPDFMAKYFYDKGKSDAITQVQKDSKNIDMKPRTSADATSPTSGFSFKLAD